MKKSGWIQVERDGAGVGVESGPSRAEVGRGWTIAVAMGQGGQMRLECLGQMGTETMGRICLSNVCTKYDLRTVSVGKCPQTH